MFEEEEEDRLLIDDNEQTEIEKNKEDRPLITTALDENRKVSPAINGFNSNREEGELEDDEMDTSIHVPVKKSEISPVNERKRVNGDVGHKTLPSEAEILAKKSKLAKIEKRDQGTCVHSEAIQADTDEPVFEMEAGSSFPLQITVVCRIEGTDTLYFSAKYKDRELSGLLTDGEPPGFTNFAKKRTALNNNSASESEKASISTPKKRVQRGQETKKKNVKTEDEDDDLDVTGDTRDSAGCGSIKLVEVNSQSLHYCPVDGCEHAYPKAIDLEYHIATLHKKKSVIYEHNSTQTQTEHAAKSMVSVQTNTEGLEEKTEVKEEVVKGLEAVEKKSGPGSHYSDISDDIAPVLSKIDEQPTTNGVAVNPSTSATGEPSPVFLGTVPAAVPEKVATPQTVVAQPNPAITPITASPRATNGLLVPAPNFISPFSIPSSSTSGIRENKPTTSTSDSSNRPITSPAQNRSQSFNPMMPQPGAGSNQVAQQYHMMQQMQQMAALQHLMGGRPFGMPTAHDLAALQALQAQAQGAGFQMFPKH